MVCRCRRDHPGTSTPVLHRRVGEPSRLFRPSGCGGVCRDKPDCRCWSRRPMRSRGCAPGRTGVRVASQASNVAGNASANTAASFMRRCTVRSDMFAATPNSAANARTGNSASRDDEDASSATRRVPRSAASAITRACTACARATTRDASANRTERSRAATSTSAISTSAMATPTVSAGAKLFECMFETLRTTAEIRTPKSTRITPKSRRKDESSPIWKPEVERAQSAARADVSRRRSRGRSSRCAPGDARHGRTAGPRSPRRRGRRRCR